MGEDEWEMRGSEKGEGGEVTAREMERIKKGEESCLAPFPNLCRLKLTAESREIQFRVI